MGTELTVEVEETDPAQKVDAHEQAMARYKALDLQIDRNGVVQLTSDAQRKLFAYGLYKSGGAPAHFKSYIKVAEAIELLQGMGTPALGNLELIYEVGGKLTAMHRLCLAACQATGEMEKHHVIFLNEKNEPLSDKNVVGFTTAACVVYCRRKGQTEDAVGAFTMEDARVAGLTSRNKNYQAFGRDMLFHRASMRALSQQFADVLQGTPCKELEEMRLMLDEEGRPLQAADGQQLYQRRIDKRAQAASAFEALKGS